MHYPGVGRRQQVWPIGFAHAMKLYAGAIDGDWFELLRSQPALDEVNIWQLSGSRQFAAQGKNWTSANTVMASGAPACPCGQKIETAETPVSSRSSEKMKL